MIEVTPICNNIILITDENYSSGRIKIIENTLKTLNADILDYEIRITEKESLLGQYVDICPYNVDSDFILTLQQFEEMETESDENLRFSMKLLCVIKENNI